MNWKETVLDICVLCKKQKPYSDMFDIYSHACNECFDALPNLTATDTCTICKRELPFSEFIYEGNDGYCICEECNEESLEDSEITEEEWNELCDIKPIVIGPCPKTDKPNISYEYGTNTLYIDFGLNREVDHIHSVNNSMSLDIDEDGNPVGLVIYNVSSLLNHDSISELSHYVLDFILGNIVK